MVNVELTPGVISGLTTRISAEIQVRSHAVVTQIGDAMDRQARTNASVGQHAYGTPTPATPGTGPSRISNTLVSSIGRSQVEPLGTGWQCKVGTVPGQIPWYSDRGVASSRYGRFLEFGLRNGTKYPWLLPAFRFGVTHATPVVVMLVFDVPWAVL